MSKEVYPYGLGRRKTAVAQVQLLAQKAKDITINKKSINDYFGDLGLQLLAISPLELTSQQEVYGLRAKIAGGGKKAQAEALRMAIARALLGIDPAWRKQLKEAGMLRRDPRVKERKKPGLKRARRAPQFSKR
jgi:small subunit ribosomal protein S9